MPVLSLLRGFKPSSSALQTFTRVADKRIAPTVPVPVPFRSLFLSSIRNGGHDQRTMHITPSRYNWQQYKDLFHFYFFLGVIPLTVLTFFINIFVGPATLEEIPPGYVPKHWEYHWHPITRWLMKYWYENPQEVYERNLHYIMEEEEGRKMKLLEWKVEKLMRERGDYPVFYSNRLFMNKYLRGHLEENWDIRFNTKGDM